MANYAKVNNSIVEQVIVAEPEFFNTFVDTTPGIWLETSYNSKDGVGLRKNYAGIGFSYDEENDAFIPPKPYNSWVLNTTTYNWEAPIADPNTETTFYNWNEETQVWDLIE